MKLHPQGYIFYMPQWKAIQDEKPVVKLPDFLKYLETINWT
jgi:hypothetical protein